MKWPWVPRLAYDTLADERDRLRAQNDTLLAHVTRMDRVEHGVGEIPRAPRPEIGPMPDELRRYIEGFAAPTTRKMMRDQAYRLRVRGAPWKEIAAQMMEDADDDETAATQP